jgi:hypothetical protein
MKECILCKENKELNDFARNKRAKDGHQNHCKTCQKVYREQRRSKPKPKLEHLQCARCSMTKPVGEFPKVGSSSTGFGSWCKECKSKYQKDYDYRDGYRNRRRERVQWFRSIKAGQPCADCGQVLEPSCMDYDHLCDKTDHVSRMVLDNTHKEKILEEIEKCELVCVLCHNKRTQKRFGFGKRKYPPHVQRNIDIINRAKSVPCEYCGNQYEPFNMQFDHLDPLVKEVNVSQLKSAKVDKLMLEISRCRVLCAVCHRRKTLMEQKGGLYPKVRKREIKRRTYIDIDKRQKECTRCKEVLNFDEFRLNKKTKSGLESWCKNCLNEYKRQRRGEKVTPPS